MTEFQIEKGIPLPPPIMPHPEGACHYCHNIPREGKKTCDECLKDVAERYRARKETGLCCYGKCVQLAGEGHVTCDAHRKLASERITALLQSRVALGVCRNCGKHPTWGVKTFCFYCYPRVGGTSGPLPKSIRVLVRQFWRFDAIASRRAKADSVIGLIPSPQARDIIALRHGLVDGIDHTLEEIGYEMGGLTRERIRQIEFKALEQIEFQGVDTSLLRPPFKFTQRPPKRAQNTTAAQRKKTAAHGAVSRATRSGELERKPCHKCGNPKSIAHHADYDKPLDVEWLCRPHHGEAYGKQIRNLPKSINWLDKADALTAHYDATAIIAALKKGLFAPRQQEIAAATGLRVSEVRQIVNGYKIADSKLLAMLRYISALK